jgi:hypothetical protein
MGITVSRRRGSPHVHATGRDVRVVTGWRINSEVLPLQCRQVDLKAGEVRLDPGTTKNLEGRVFYLTSELKELLNAQRKAADRIQRRKGMIVQHVFFHDLLSLLKTQSAHFCNHFQMDTDGVGFGWSSTRRGIQPDMSTVRRFEESGRGSPCRH